MALIQHEPGGDVVSQALDEGATISAVNLSEVIAKLADSGAAEALIRSALARLNVEVVAFDAELAYSAGLLRPLTRQAGLSLGDRACLALARRLAAEVITTDRSWAELGLEVAVRVAR